MNRDQTPHTDWCGQGHYCGLSEHRSEPGRQDMRWGGIVATLVQTATGEPFLELRLRVHIPPQEQRARLRAHLIATEIGQAVDFALVEADISYLLAADPTLRTALPGPGSDWEVTA